MLKRIRGALVTAALSAVLPMSAASAAQIVASASKDATIYANSAGVDTGNASGKGPGLPSGADGSSGKKRSLIAFDLSAIPSNATVTGVTMTLYLGQVAGSGGSNDPALVNRDIRLFNVQQNWAEGNSGTPTSSNIGMSGQGYARLTGDVTWDNARYDAAGSTAWNDGSPRPGGNFNTTASASAVFSTFTLGAAYEWKSTDAGNAAMVTDVQNWVSGATTNNGWLLKSEAENIATSFLSFWSKEGAVANTAAGSEPPTLTVTYSVPEPASLAVVAVAGLLGIRARTRRIA